MPRAGIFSKALSSREGNDKRCGVARWWETVVGPDGKTERLRRSEVLGPVADMPTRREAQQVLFRPAPLDQQRRLSTAIDLDAEKLHSGSMVAGSAAHDKHSTKQHYDYVVNCHLIPALGDMQLRLITRDSVQSFLSGKLKTGLSWRTVKHVRTTLGRF